MAICYFILGTGITLGLNSWIGNFAEDFWAGVVSILGGVAGSMAVAWLRHKWEKRKATGIDNSVCMTAQSQHLRLGGCFVSIVFFDFFIDKIGEWVIIAIFV